MPLNYKENAECSVCLENILNEDKVVTESCNHSFCKSCLETWAFENPTCPLDRSKLTNVLINFQSIELCKIVSIERFILEGILKDRNNTNESFIKNIINILSKVVGAYNRYVLITSELQRIYSYFEESRMQSLLNLDSNIANETFLGFFKQIH